MKIGYDAKRLFCNTTGLGNYSRTLVHNLQKHAPQNEYYLYTPKQKKLSEAQHFKQNEAYHIYVSKASLKAWWRSLGITKQLQNDQLDIYHGLSNELPFGLNKTAIKSVVTIHDLIFKIYPDTYPFFDRLFYDVKFKNSCLQADKIIAISESTKTDIVHYYNIKPEKIEVIYQSCLPHYFETDCNEKAYQKLPNEYLLYVGSVIPRKNLKLIIEAYKLLPKDCSIPLVIVGQGKQYKKKMNQLIRKYGLEKLFIWLSSVDSQQLKTLYRQAQLLVYPSFYEGFGLPVAEALLCKTPVITAQTSSLKEAGGNTSIYIDPKNAEELAIAIERVLTNSNLRKKMKDNGLDYAIQHFSPKITSQKMLDCYNQLSSVR